jgi:hypothetical protein
VEFGKAGMDRLGKYRLGTAGIFNKEKHERRKRFFGTDGTTEQWRVDG